MIRQERGKIERKKQSIRWKEEKQQQLTRLRLMVNWWWWWLWWQVPPATSKVRAPVNWERYLERAGNRLPNQFEVNFSSNISLQKQRKKWQRVRLLSWPTANCPSANYRLKESGKCTWLDDWRVWLVQLRHIHSWTVIIAVTCKWVSIEHRALSKHTRLLISSDDIWRRKKTKRLYSAKWTER